MYNLVIRDIIKNRQKIIAVCEVFDLKVSYKKLWVMLAEREMTNVELRKLVGIAPATFTKLRKNQEVALSILMKIAEVLDCDAGDIVSFIKEPISDNDASRPA